MTAPTLTLTELRRGDPEEGLLLVGPSLGTAVTPLWDACAQQLPDGLRVVGWDLPGHGRSPAHGRAFTIELLAEAVAAASATVREQARGPVVHAGVSLGGAVGLQLAIAHPEVLDGLAVLCSGARIGEPAGWHERAELVRLAGTPVMVEGSARRWFAAGSIAREPAAAAALLDSLQHADRFDYAACCQALAAFDVRDRLSHIAIPVLAVAGEEDEVTPTSSAQQIAAGTGGRVAVVEQAAHLAPAEQPTAVADLLGAFVNGIRDAAHTPPPSTQETSR